MSAGAEAILSEIDARGVATITFDRPDKSNAFDAGMRRRLAAELARLAGDPSVRLLILRGAGRHFSAGSDVGSFGAEAPEERVEHLLRLDGFPKPTVALVQGACVGAALGVVACCDIVIAATDGFFSIPEVRLGLAPLGLAPLFLRALGAQAFRRYALTGERFDSAEALRLGLAHKVCAPGELGAHAAKLADELLQAAPGAIAELKRAARALSSPGIDAEIVRLAREEREHMQGREAREGVAAFRDKRSPSWVPKK